MTHRIEIVMVSDDAVTLEFRDRGAPTTITMSAADARTLRRVLDDQIDLHSSFSADVELAPSPPPAPRPPTSANPVIVRVIMRACGLVSSWRARSLRASNVETLHFIQEAAADVGALARELVEAVHGAGAS